MDKKVDIEALEEKVNEMGKKVDHHHSFIKVLDGKNSTEVGVED